MKEKAEAASERRIMEAWETPEARQPALKLLAGGIQAGIIQRTNAAAALNPVAWAELKKMLRAWGEAQMVTAALDLPERPGWKIHKRAPLVRLGPGGDFTREIY